MSSPITGRVPRFDDAANESEQNSLRRALEYMGVAAGTPIQDIRIDCAFIGSCTNARIEDLREAARILRGRKIHPSVRTIVVPGSGLVKTAAEQEGLDRVFKDAGAEWREPGG